MMLGPKASGLVVSRADKIFNSALFVDSFVRNTISFGFSVDSNLDSSNVMRSLEENVAVVADQSRLFKGSFQTACSLQLEG